METCKGFNWGIPRVLACIYAALALGGCGHLQVSGTVRTKSETEIAVEQIRDEWLKVCETLKTPMPTNSVENLQRDYTDLAAALAVCISRQTDFVNYMKPFVQKERGAKKTP